MLSLTAAGFAARPPGVSVPTDNLVERLCKETGNGLAVLDRATLEAELKHFSQPVAVLYVSDVAPTPCASNFDTMTSSIGTPRGDSMLGHDALMTIRRSSIDDKPCLVFSTEQGSTSVCCVLANTAAVTALQLRNEQDILSYLARSFAKDPSLKVLFQDIVKRLLQGQLHHCNHFVPGDFGRDRYFLSMRIWPFAYRTSPVQPQRDGGGGGGRGGSSRIRAERLRCPVEGTGPGGLSEDDMDLVGITPAIILELDVPYEGKELAARLQRDYMIISNIPSIVTMFDMDGRVLHQNRSSVAYMGYLVGMERNGSTAASASQAAAAAAEAATRSEESDDDVAATAAAAPAAGAAVVAAVGRCDGGVGVATGARAVQNDRLQQLFAHEPAKLQEMLKAMSEGAEWRGLLRMPARVQWNSMDDQESNGEDGNPGEGSTRRTPNVRPTGSAAAPAAPIDSATSAADAASAVALAAASSHRSGEASLSPLASPTTGFQRRSTAAVIRELQATVKGASEARSRSAALARQSARTSSVSAGGQCLSSEQQQQQQLRQQQQQQRELPPRQRSRPRLQSVAGAVWAAGDVTGEEQLLEELQHQQPKQQQLQQKAAEARRRAASGASGAWVEARPVSSVDARRPAARLGGGSAPLPLAVAAAAGPPAAAGGPAVARCDSATLAIGGGGGDSSAAGSAILAHTAREAEVFAGVGAAATAAADDDGAATVLGAEFIAGAVAGLRCGAAEDGAASPGLAAAAPDRQEGLASESAAAHSGGNPAGAKEEASWRDARPLAPPAVLLGPAAAALDGPGAEATQASWVDPATCEGSLGRKLACSLPIPVVHEEAAGAVRASRILVPVLSASGSSSISSCHAGMESSHREHLEQQQQHGERQASGIGPADPRVAASSHKLEDVATTTTTTGTLSNPPGMVVEDLQCAEAARAARRGDDAAAGEQPPAAVPTKVGGGCGDATAGGLPPPLESPPPPASPGARATVVATAPVGACGEAAVAGCDADAVPAAAPAPYAEDVAAALQNGDGVPRSSLPNTAVATGSSDQGAAARSAPALDTSNSSCRSAEYSAAAAAAPAAVAAATAPAEHAGLLATCSAEAEAVVIKVVELTTNEDGDLEATAAGVAPLLFVNEGAQAAWAPAAPMVPRTDEWISSGRTGRAPMDLLGRGSVVPEDGSFLINTDNNFSIELGMHHLRLGSVMQAGRSATDGSRGNMPASWTAAPRTLSYIDEDKTGEEGMEELSFLLPKIPQYGPLYDSPYVAPRPTGPNADDFSSPLALELVAMPASTPAPTTKASSAAAFAPPRQVVQPSRSLLRFCDPDIPAAPPGAAAPTAALMHIVSEGPSPRRGAGVLSPVLHDTAAEAAAEPPSIFAAYALQQPSTAAISAGALFGRVHSNPACMPRTIQRDATATTAAGRGDGGGASAIPAANSLPATRSTTTYLQHTGMDDSKRLRAVLKALVSVATDVNVSGGAAASSGSNALTMCGNAAGWSASGLLSGGHGIGAAAGTHSAAVPKLPRGMAAGAGASGGVRTQGATTAAATAAAAAVAAACSSPEPLPGGGGASRWHEVHVRPCFDPMSSEPLTMVIQTDVTSKVRAEELLARVLEAEHRLLADIFPRHVVQYMTQRRKDEAELERNGLTLLRHIQDPAAVATLHDHVTVLFADIKGFTEMSKEVPPAVVMTFLNDLYTRFDSLTDVYGVYKVETIGDCYMVAGGLMARDGDGYGRAVRGAGDTDPLHAMRVVAFARAMLEEAAKVVMPNTGEPVKVRVGLHSGSVMSGVVGQKMPRFCLFGDTINTASRMESTGRPGAIHVSCASRQLLPPEEDEELWAATGGVEVKGKGRMDTYLWCPQSPAADRRRRDKQQRAMLLGTLSALHRPSASASPPNSMRLVGPGGRAATAAGGGGRAGALPPSQRQQSSSVSRYASAAFDTNSTIV